MGHHIKCHGSRCANEQYYPMHGHVLGFGLSTPSSRFVSVFVQASCDRNIKHNILAKSTCIEGKDTQDQQLLRQTNRFQLKIVYCTCWPPFHETNNIIMYYRGRCGLLRHTSDPCMVPRLILSLSLTYISGRSRKFLKLVASQYRWV